ncbi:hypothetical protein NPIL_62631 [Nephila pilipes]|uniref:Uncharacterized protein n=1 Tax=Nephila pilipes TaxID=299642 RepID=A0A8X6MWB9_NEPPI|nr:hypothetical protein NPIL_62631 [Nephila pilipes]
MEDDKYIGFFSLSRNIDALPLLSKIFATLSIGSAISCLRMGFRSGKMNEFLLYTKLKEIEVGNQFLNQDSLTLKLQIFFGEPFATTHILA